MICLMILQQWHLSLGKKVITETKGKGTKILAIKQMLKRLPIPHAQVKVGNASEILLQKIR